MINIGRRRVIGGLAVAALASMSPGCAPGSNRKRIAVSFHNMAEPFFVVMRRELLAEAEVLGVDVSVLDGQANSAKQTADIETALVQGVDGVILAPTDVTALVPAVNAVLKEGRPIVTVDRRVERASAHIGADNVAGGRMMVEWIVANHPDGARIVLLTGQPGSSSAIDRTRGVKEAVAAAGSRYRIIAEQSANWSRDQGLTVSQNILTALGGNRPDVILAENDDMALGAVEALRTAGLSGIAVLGFDATPEALARIRDGDMALTVEQSPSRQIREALRQIVQARSGQTGLTSVSIEPVVITRANIRSAERFAEVQ
jgi:inositol transport system substrate-binding protein